MAGRPVYTRRFWTLRLYWGMLATLGFILSPLSWWNDLFVNIPLAVFLASLVSNLGLLGFTEAFVLSYWATNVIGIVMMLVGARGAIGGKVGFRDLGISMVVSLAYTLLAVGLMGAFVDS